MINASLAAKVKREIAFIFEDVDSKDGTENDGLLSYSELLRNHKYLTNDEEFTAAFHSRKFEQIKNADEESIESSMVEDGAKIPTQKDDEAYLQSDIEDHYGALEMSGENRVTEDESEDNGKEMHIPDELNPKYEKMDSDIHNDNGENEDIDYDQDMTEADEFDSLTTAKKKTSAISHFIRK